MRLRHKGLVVLLITAVVVLFSGAPVFAVHDTDTFELDGNPQEQAATGDDWELIFDGGGSNFAEAFRRDWSDPTDTTYLHTGGSKDDLDFPSWVRTTNDEAPDKDEIMNSFAAAYNVGGQLVIYFGADRFDDEGDAQMGFWFTQDDVSISGTDVNGTHEDGDVLVQSNFVGGGKVGEIQVYEWVGSGGSHGPLDLVADIQDADCTDASSDAACAIVNTGEDVVPVWDFDNKDGSEYNSGEFYEGGINLDELGIQTDCFSTFIAETRTSHPFDARLKDISIGDFDTCATKKGTKFEDVDGDGHRDEGEPGLEDWTIHLFGEGVHLHEQTDGNGDYEFGGLEPGEYTVCETQEDGWLQSYPGDGAGTTSCAGHDHDGAPGARGYAIDLSFGEVDSGNDFGNFRMASKSGVKYHDRNADGDRDDGEETLAGWQVHLYGTDGLGNAVHEHDTTDGDGAYSFDVPPGNYMVCEEQQAGWTQSEPAGSDNCGDHGDGVGYAISLDSGEDDTGNDFGNFEGATKSGTKFVDLNANGVRDDGEPGLGGVEIHVFGTSGGGAAVHEHDTTDADGSYHFDLDPGSYTVCESIPDGWTQSYPTTGPDCSTHAGADGTGYSISLDSDEDDTGNDFGNYQAAHKLGRKFVDTNANGVWDEGEPTRAGVEVTIFDTSWAVVATTTTDEDGAYGFTVIPGSYYVCETVEEGWEQTYPAAGEGIVDCAGHGGGNGYTITLTSGQTEENNDFGNFQNAQKLGTKFHDLDADGEWDSGEPGLEGWEITLVGTDGRGNAVDEVAVTDSAGDYAFDVPPGDYTVCETQQEGWTQSYPAQGADCGDGVGYAITLASGGVEEDNDFGNYQRASKSGTKFRDDDGDGVRDAGEPGIQGWHVHLFGTDGQGNDVHEHGFTDADGDYVFDGLLPGSYTVCETVGTPVGLEPGVTLTVSADPESGSPGDTVTYTYTVTNTGEVALTEIVVTDDDLGQVGTAGSLEPGASVAFTVDEALVEDDIDRDASVSAEAGWRQTFPADGADCAGHGGGVGYAITLTSGLAETGNDFGNQRVNVDDSGGTTVTVVLPRRLVRTGSDPFRAVPVGVGLLGLGIALVQIARRFELRGVTAE